MSRPFPTGARSGAGRTHRPHVWVERCDTDAGSAVGPSIHVDLVRRTQYRASMGPWLGCRVFADRGPRLDEPYTRQLDGQLREGRFYIGRCATRITYWIASGWRIILLAALPRSACAKIGKSTECDERSRSRSQNPARHRRRHDAIRRRPVRSRQHHTNPPVVERIVHALEVDLAVQLIPHSRAIHGPVTRATSGTTRSLKTASISKPPALRPVLVRFPS
jgi:hypothetical protein